MSEEYTFVAYTPDYEEDLLSLASYVWSVSPALNQSYLKWKYESSPYTTAPRFYLALHQGRAVGMRGLMGSRWESGDESYELPCFGDSATAPEHRRRGLMTRITRAALEHMESDGHGCTISLSAGAATRKAFLANGAMMVDMPVTYSRGWNGGEAQASKNPGPSEPRLSHQRLQVAPMIWLEDRPRPHAMAGLIERLPRDGRIRHVRDEAFFSWRFDNPLCRYWFLFRETSAELDGYLVLQKSHKLEALYNFVDCEAVEPGILAELVRAALGLSGAGRINAWPNALTGNLSDTLAELGFDLRQGDYEYRILVGATSRTQAPAEWRLGSQDLRDPANWDMRMIYSDNY